MGLPAPVRFHAPHAERAIIANTALKKGEHVEFVPVATTSTNESPVITAWQDL